MDPFTIMAGVSAGTSIIGGLMGSRGEKQAAAARAAAIQEGQRQFDAQAGRAEGFVNDGTDRAMGFVEPFARDGRRGFELYLDAIGVNGREAQSAYQDGFQTDPGFQASLDAGRAQIEHSNMVRGRGDSGAAMKELYGFGQREQLGAFRDRLDRLSQLSSMGFQAGSAAGSLEAGRGSTLADIAMKRGQSAKDSAMGVGGAQAQGITGSTNQFVRMAQGLGTAGMIGSGSLDGGAALASIYGGGSRRTPTAAPAAPQINRSTLF